MSTPYRLALILVALACSTIFGTVAHAGNLPVPKNLQEEATTAREKQVPILVLFMSDDCTYCETALNDFLLPMQRDPEFANKVVLRQIETSKEDTLTDFDGKVTTYSRFARKHKVSVVPHVMLFDSLGRELESIQGLLTVDFYYGFLVKAIEDSTTTIRGLTIQR
jgi:thioredoxin-related protein